MAASVSEAKWLVGIMASVVLAFALATIVTEYYERAVEDRAQEIIGKAMPSLQMISVARGNLRGLENDLERLSASPPEARGTVADDVRAMRRELDASLAAYDAVPYLPAEHDLFVEVDRARVGLERTIETFLAAPSDELLAQLHHHVDLVDGAIQRIVELDASSGRRLGMQIRSVHQRATVLAAFLDSLSFLLALAATVLALRQLRRTGRQREAAGVARDQRERELAEQNEALGNFAGRVAHDVLSPLGTVQLSLDLLRETVAREPATQRVVERGQSAVRSVKTLVDDLLAFSRAGGHPEPGVSTQVAPVLADVLAELGPQAREHQITLTRSAAPAGAVACSAGVLTSIISNLVRNAIKYTKDSVDRRIEVRVQHVGSRWRFEVQDTGPGVPLDAQKRIFEPYVQLAKGSDGIGLGLATVERLVRAHGGAVGVMSAAPHGALFWFELPAFSGNSALTAHLHALTP